MSQSERIAAAREIAERDAAVDAKMQPKASMNYIGGVRMLALIEEAWQSGHGAEAVADVVQAYHNVYRASVAGAPSWAERIEHIRKDLPEAFTHEQWRAVQEAMKRRGVS